MGKTIAIIGTVNNLNVQEYIVNQVNQFFGIEAKFGDLKSIANSYIEPEAEKIPTEMISAYINNLAQTNLNYNQKLGIITNFEFVSVLNQNKLLKTFEDNPENTLQIIVVNRESKLLGTIKSRMLMVDLRQEKLEFSCLDREQPFFEKIIKEQKEADFLKENPEIKNTLIAMYEEFEQNQVTSAYVLYTNRIKEYSKTLNCLVVRIIFNYLYEVNQIKLLIKLFDYEQRFEYLVNERLQVEALFVEVRSANYE